MMHSPKLTQHSKITTTFLALFVFLACTLTSLSVSAQTKTQEAQLNEVLDTVAIQKLLGQYMNFVDAAEFESYANLFTENGELIFQSFHLTGREEIFKLMSGSTPPSTSDEPRRATLVHTMSNSLIELESSNTASHVARWINMSGNEDGQPVMRATGLYKDVLKKVEGEWKIQRRIVTNDIPYVETTFMTE